MLNPQASWCLKGVVGEYMCYHKNILSIVQLPLTMGAMQLQLL